MCIALESMTMKCIVFFRMKLINQSLNIYQKLLYTTIYCDPTHILPIKLCFWLIDWFYLEKQHILHRHTLLIYAIDCYSRLTQTPFREWLTLGTFSNFSIMHGWMTSLPAQPSPFHNCNDQQFLLSYYREIWSIFEMAARS